MPAVGACAGERVKIARPDLPSEPQQAVLEGRLRLEAGPPVVDEGPLELKERPLAVEEGPPAA